MSEYIEREAVTAMLKRECSPRVMAYLVDELCKIPAADVRPVVTCGKCKYGKDTGTEWFCDKHSGHADKFGEDASYHEYHSEHWFCADGEES